MDIAEQLVELATTVRALEREVKSLRAENRRLKLQANRNNSSAPPPPDEDPWAVLGIPQTATKEEVMRAFRLLSKQHHPDTPGGSRERFEQIVAAKAAII